MPFDSGMLPGFTLDRAYIDGEWIAGESDFAVTNPANDSVVGRVPDLGIAAAEAATGAAHRAFAAWRARTAADRATLLHEWARLVRIHGEGLAALMTAEQGKPLAEARGEVNYAASFLDWFAEEARRVAGEIVAPHAVDRRIMVRREPVGVVAAITPWNFPLAMITRKAAPALAAGCTMVLKPSELTPLSALALCNLAERAGIPAGVFNVVTGQDAPAIGGVLTGDKRIRKFTFTGSTRVGKLLAARCMETVKRVSLELGGNAPLIVFDDADLDAAVEGAIASKFRNSGQTCVCANRMLVQAGIYDRFAARLAARVSELVCGPGATPGVDQGPLIDRRAVEKALSHVADAVAGGARVIAGGVAPVGLGSFFAPTVMVNVAPDAKLCREETFGPVAGLVRFTDESEAITMANATDAGLAAYVFTRDMDRSWRVTEALEYGMVGLNTGLISTEVSPFGGVKQSGFGREGSVHGLADYLALKSVCIAVTPPQDVQPNQ